VDEVQHFTSHRLLALSLSPDDAVLGYDRDQYMALCDQTAGRADRYRASKDAKCFGEGGRQRQRAYNDALRDLAAPALGHPGVIRAPALDQDGAAAWRAVSLMLASNRRFAVYHRTDAADAIMRSGFLDGTGAYLTKNECTGVWVSDVPFSPNEGAVGSDVLEIQAPEAALAPHEVGDDHSGTREWLVPAELLNRYQRRILTEQEVDVLLDEQFRTRISPSPIALRNLWPTPPAGTVRSK
jgi:hypothetical protein